MGKRTEIRVRLLVVERDARYGEWLRHHLGVLCPDEEVVQQSLAEFGRSSFSGAECDVLLLSASFGSSPEDPQAQGLEMLRQLRELARSPVIIAVAEEGNELTAVRALQLGAVDYLPKRLLTPDRLRTSVRLAVRLVEKRTARRVAGLAQDPPTNTTRAAESRPAAQPLAPQAEFKQQRARAAGRDAQSSEAKRQEPPASEESFIGNVITAARSGEDAEARANKAVSTDVGVDSVPSAGVHGDNAAGASVHGDIASGTSVDGDNASATSVRKDSESNVSPRASADPIAGAKTASNADAQAVTDTNASKQPESDATAPADANPNASGQTDAGGGPRKRAANAADRRSTSDEELIADTIAGNPAELAADAQPHLESTRPEITNARETASAEAPERFAAGKHLDADFFPGYRILDTLGESEKAAVYVATSAALGHRVALKVSKTLRDDTAGRQFLEREYTAIAAIREACVVRIYDYGIQSGLEYLAMEYLPQGDLKARMQRGMNDSQALRYVEQIAGALQVVHQAGLLHRDLKPPNVMLREDGNVALIDFGLARALDGSSPSTQTGVLRGSPYYMSPEQALGEILDARTDFYSLGIMFYEMLTGRKPYVGASAMEVLQQHVHAPVPQLPKHVAHHGPLLERLMAKSRDERFGSAAEILAAISVAREGEQTQSSAA